MVMRKNCDKGECRRRELEADLAQAVREREDYNGKHQVACIRIEALEAALTEIRDILPIEQDAYSRRIFNVACMTLAGSATYEDELK